MLRKLSILASISVVACALGSISMGCSSSTSGGGGGSGSSSGSSGGATVSFSNDVMPAFQAGCTLTSECHGQTGNTAEENLYLGENNPDSSTGEPVDPGVAMMVYNGLVGVPSLEDPSMPLVTKGDPTTSYLIQKLNNTQNNFAAGCMKSSTPCSATSSTCTSATPCGTSMPDDGTLWSQGNQAALTAVTNWISQGALNN